MKLTTQKHSYPFSAGLGSVFMLIPDMRRKSFARQVLRRSDAVAMKSDWQAVGNDLRGAMHSASESSRVDKDQMAFDWPGFNGA